MRRSIDRNSRISGCKVPERGSLPADMLRRLFWNAGTEARLHDGATHAPGIIYTSSASLPTLCSSCIQVSELRARTEADCWDVQAWEALCRETVAAAAKQPPADATAQEIAVLEQLLRQFPSAV